MATQLEIDKRRALAKALLAQQAPQGQQAGRFYVAPSGWAQALAGITSGVGQYQSLKADKEQADLGKETQRKIAQAIAAQGTDPAIQSAASALPPDQQGAVLGQIVASKLAPKAASRRAPLVIAGPDGKPQYAEADDAVGKTPYFPSGASPAKVQEYQFAKENGYTGGYEDFLKIGQGGVGNFNPGDYTPESFATFQKSGNPVDLKRYVAPAQPSVQVVSGVPTMVQGSRTGGAPTQSPLTTLDATTDAGRQIKQAEAEGAARGAASGTATGGIIKKGIESANVLGLLNQADALVDISTGSGAGAAADAAAGFFGFAPDGAQAAASLKVLGANLLLGLPRLEGPQSDRDTNLYKEASAQIGDATVPAEVKKSALQTVRRVQQQYADQFKALGGSSDAGASKVDSLVEKYRTKK